jgi:hypothetical protein
MNGNSQFYYTWYASFCFASLRRPLRRDCETVAGSRAKAGRKACRFEDFRPNGLHTFTARNVPWPCAPPVLPIWSDEASKMSVQAPQNCSSVGGTRWRSAAAVSAERRRFPAESPPCARWSPCSAHAAAAESPRSRVRLPGDLSGALRRPV